MGVKEVLNKYKPLIIIILLFTLAFSLRAEAVNISGVPQIEKSLYENSNGVPYFSEIDSYYNLRNTQTYLAHGYIGDTVINGTDWDSLSYAPPGSPSTTAPMIVYLTAFTYKFVNLFAKVPLTTVAFWLPAFIGSLVVIPAYLFVRRITNDYGGITAAILAATAPAYFSHNFAGFFTTEMFNVLLPLLIVWFFVESIRANNMRNRSIFIVLSALILYIFSLSWFGWIYSFYLIIGVAIVYLIVSHLLKFETIKKRSDYNNIGRWFIDQPTLFALVIFIVLGIIFTLISVGPSSFISTILEPLGFTQLQASTLAHSTYPNALVSVAELQIPSIIDTISDIGGYVVLAFAAIGVFLLFWRLRTTKEEKPPEEKPQNVRSNKRRSKRYKSKNKNSKNQNNQSNKKTPTDKKYIIPELTGREKNVYLLYGILLVIWILTMTYALKEGVRFALELSTPLALGAGIFIGLIYEYVKKYTNVPSYRTIVMALLIIIAVFSSVSSAYSISSSVVPGTDTAMVNSLNWIKMNTPNNTVITSWWDFGYLFEYYGDRPSTWDGGNQNTPRAYWVGEALYTDNESLSVGILSMLANSGDLAPQAMDNYTNNTGKSVQILNSILGVDNTTAYNIMTTQYNLSPAQAQTILNYTHPANPTPFVLITSSDMIDKAYWWSYFGNWNFQTNNSTGYNYEEGQATVVPSNETGLSSNTTLLVSNDNAVVAQIVNNNVSAGLINTQLLQNENLSTSELTSQLVSGLQGNNSLVVQPNQLIVIQGNNVTQNETVNSNSPISMIINDQNGTIDTVVMNTQLMNSMFTRLYLLGGMGLNQYKLVEAQPGVFVWTG
jgi:asparagine N-glycosylation enzyme membrane subunit Stt3